MIVSICRDEELQNCRTRFSFGTGAMISSLLFLILSFISFGLRTGAAVSDWHGRRPLPAELESHSTENVEVFIVRTGSLPESLSMRRSSTVGNWRPTCFLTNFSPGPAPGR